jgi:hypothetical protein
MRDLTVKHNPRIQPRVCYMHGCNRISCIEANAEYVREWRRGPKGQQYREKRRVKTAQRTAQRLREQAALASE